MSPRDSSLADDLSRRLTALEERLTFQQRMLDELHEALLGQDRRLEQAAVELVRHAAALQRLAETSRDDLPHEKPPHY